MSVGGKWPDEPGGAELPFRWAVILAIAAAVGITVGAEAGMAAGVTAGIAVAAFLHVVTP